MTTLNELNPALDHGAYIIYVRSENILAKWIHFFMRLYALRFNRIWRKPVNHSDIMIAGWVCGSQFPVSRSRTFEGYYNDGKSRELFIYRIEPQKDISSAKLDLFIYGTGVPYDYKNFYDFIYKLFTGRWRGRTGKEAEKRMYCIELSHYLMRKMDCKCIMDGSDWDNDPEQSRQWAMDNLEFIGSYKINNGN
jgi:hypothetical protein